VSAVKHAIISCAGLGSRLGLNKPKALVDFLGESLIHRILGLLDNFENVRIVTGFMEMELMAHILERRQDVVFVRNKDYTSTANLYSLSLAVKEINESFITIDGDLIIDRSSFQDFINLCADRKDCLVGIADTKTEEPICVDLDNNSRITRFHREYKTAYEWCGIAYVSDLEVKPENRFVYTLFDSVLPVQSCSIKCYEIDTPADMELALQSYKD
jgi:choline kinase